MLNIEFHILKTIVFTGWKNLFSEGDEMMDIDDELAFLNDGDNDEDENMVDIIRNARRLNLDVEPADIDEMLAEDPLDFTTDELQELAMMTTKKRSEEEAAATAAAGQGILVSKSVRDLKEGMEIFAKARAFMGPLVDDRKDEVAHLFQMVDNICGHAVRNELKKREKQTTMDRSVVFNKAKLCLIISMVCALL
jgi:hypothetical protein